MFTGFAFAYSITHYRLFNIRIRLAQALTYTTAILSIILAGWYTSQSLSNHINPIIVNTLTILTAITLYAPLSHILQKAFNLLIFGQTKNYLEQLTDNIRTILKQNIDIPAASHHILTTITQALGLHHCRFLAAGEIQLPLTPETTKLLNQQQNLYVAELESRAEAEDDQASATLADYLRSQDIAVLQPIYAANDQKIIGALSLSPKRNGATFSREELSALVQLATETQLILTNQPKPDFTIHQTAYNALAGSLISVESLRGQLQQPAQQTALSSITQGIGKTYRALQHVEYLAELEQLEPKLLRRPTQLSRVIDEILEYQLLDKVLLHLGVFHPAPKIQLRTKTQPETLVSANTHYLQHIILELLLNAALYGQAPILLETCEDSESVTIRITNKLTPKKELTKAQLLQIFSGDAPPPQREHGAGYGLSFTKQFLAAIGGYFSFKINNSKMSVEVILAKVCH